jgi:ATP phosphoribosyltransferase
MRYLTIALTKGRLAEKTLEMLEAVGITCEEMKDKKTRKLIFVNEELKLRFFLAKGPDVPTYVEYGAADLGVVGRDTILEEGRKLYEVMDLGFGKCRMCICGPESARELLDGNQQIRVATKYPNIAKDYFYNKKKPDRGNHQIKRFHRAGTDRRTFRSHLRYRRDRFHSAGKWSAYS